jgi:hypothetical protein
MSAAVAGTTFRPTPSYTTLRDATLIAPSSTAVDVQRLVRRRGPHQTGRSGATAPVGSCAATIGHGEPSASVGPRHLSLERGNDRLLRAPRRRDSCLPEGHGATSRCVVARTALSTGAAVRDCRGSGSERGPKRGGRLPPSGARLDPWGTVDDRECDDVHHLLSPRHVDAQGVSPACFE